MFQDLDAALARLLDDPSVPDPLRAADVSFETPSGAYSPSADTLNIFLHDLREDRELRDPVPIIELRGGDYVQRMPPLRIECDYAVTAWADASNGVALKVQHEHQLLGQALGWLSQFPTLPSAYLLGDMADQAFPPPALVAHADADRYNGTFWSALGIPPRPAFRLSVVVAVELRSETVIGPPVRTISTDFENVLGASDEWRVQLGGYVRDRAGLPLADALVRVVETGAETRSDASGRYVLAGFSKGACNVQVVALGQQPKSQRVLVPGRAEDYDIILDPL